MKLLAIGTLPSLAIAATCSCQTIVLRAPTNPVPMNSVFGCSLSAMPDVDNDGVDDIVVGAYQDNSSVPPFSGRAYVFSGRTGLFIRELMAVEPNGSSQLGLSVAGVRGVGGAGWVIAGAHTETSGSSPFAAGRAYLFDARTGDVIFHFQAPDEFARANFGMYVQAVPDVDGDQVDDVVVGSRIGRFTVFSTRTGSLVTEIDQSSQYAQVLGVGSIPSIEATAVGDVVVSAELVRAHPHDPRVFVTDIYSGSTGARLRRHGDLIGYSIASISDCDGDGVADIVLGSPSESLAGLPAQSGVVRIISSLSGAVVRQYASPHPTELGSFGASVAGTSDIDGDGFPDIVCGAWGEWRPPAPDHSGVAYVISGVSGRPIRELLSSRPLPDGHFGSSVGVLADSNGDGRPEVMVAANLEWLHAPADRQAYLFPSCAADSNGDGAVDSRDLFEFIGLFFAGGADFNRDGRANSQDFFDFLAAFFAGC